MAREKLEEHGYRMIRVYEGSFDDWKENGGEVETVQFGCVYAQNTVLSM